MGVVVNGQQARWDRLSADPAWASRIAERDRQNAAERDRVVAAWEAAAGESAERDRGTWPPAAAGDDPGWQQQAGSPRAARGALLAEARRQCRGAETPALRAMREMDEAISGLEDRQAQRAAGADSAAARAGWAAYVAGPHHGGPRQEDLMLAARFGREHYTRVF
jgi:hypothetical protein